MPIVDLRDIHLTRGGTEILRGVSWCIEPGRHCALLGANGSGKTTLLRVIAGLEWPTSGTVRVLGKVFGQCDLPTLRKTIGWVTSSLAARLPGNHTGLEIVASGFEASVGLYTDLTAHQWDQGRQALRSVGMEAFEQATYGTMSQGEQQRVLIARGIVHRPKLLILDEPCAGLDPAVRESFLADLSRIVKRRGAPTVVFVTHHIEEIGPWITSGLVLRGGEVLASGPIASVLTGEVLGKAFGRRCRVEIEDGRRWLRLDRGR